MKHHYNIGVSLSKIYSLKKGVKLYQEK